MRAVKIVGIALVVVSVLIVGVSIFLGKMPTRVIADLLSGEGASAPGLEGSVAAAQSGLTARVTRGSIEETVSAAGNVAANSQSTLTFISSGRIAEVLVVEGERVDTGQVLARLESGSQERAVARAEAALGTAQSRLDQAQRPASEAEFASAQAGLDGAKANLERLLAGATEEDLESAKLNVEAAGNQLSNAQAALTSARANLTRLLAGPTELDLESAKLSIDAAKNQLWGAQAQRDSIAGSPQQSPGQKDSAEAQVHVAEVGVDQALLAQERMLEPPTAEDVAMAQSQVDSAKAQVHSAEVGVEQALVAQEKMLKPPTAEDVNITQSQVDQAEAQLAQLREKPRAEDVALALAQVDEAALALAQARELLDDSLITAPFGGTILTVSVNPGEWATPGVPAIVLANMDDLVLDVNLDEIDVALVAPGQMARISFDALPKEEATGTIRSISPAATNVGGAVAYRVEMAFAAGDLPVRLGMTTNVDIVTGREENALLVPNRAIRSDRDAGRYYASRKSLLGGAEEVEVWIGMRDDEHTQILSGLNEGDTLVLAQLAGAIGAPGEAQGPGFPGMGAMRNLGNAGGGR